ncbi:transglycosylase domain-containing protein [Actinokineospora auranticolor]|uniref:Membrane peptidoglycan carboxypeptidase n=1 Tax=Actinokineospora auranticolor TaxID=155976 RepID=A0A2S6GS63_9PSEU|nr:transglycosylase domain-containing protein [Actinokineospora auranticolor]PPK68026.1 membrane peptidoglycan carboxypeptidase [Actinokineospora auranticolor]
MNDHSDHRRRPEPEWPSGDDPDTGRASGSDGKPKDPAAGGKADQPKEESTGFWSPLWEDDGDGDAPGPGPARGDAPRQPGPGPRGPQAGPANGRGPGGPNRPAGPPQGGPGKPNGAPPRPGAPAPGPGGPGGRGPNGPGGPGGPSAPTSVMGAPGRPGGPNGPGGPRPTDATMAITPPGAADRTVAIPPAKPDPGAAQTVFIPKGHGQTRPSEPQLLTHREPEPDLDDYDDEKPDVDTAQPSEEELRKRRRKKIWRRVRRTLYVAAGLMIVGPIVAFFITYQLVDVDNPNDVARDQDKVVTLLYANGDEMAKIAKPEANRVMLKPGEIPKTVLHAVYAAEDSTFETNAGFDITGIMRAVWNNATGGKGGGSTITQQYIKTASGDDDPTLTRKWVEVVKAYKMNETYSKDEIITAYLNTIYFGRGAWGIASAAKMYYGVTDLNQLTKSQAALLGGMIQSPSRYKDTTYQHSRWDFVTKQMVQNGWMTEAELREAAFPELVPMEQNKAVSLTGPRARIPFLIEDELASLGYSMDKVKKNGYKITTTIDPRAQQLAEDAVNDVMKNQPKNLMPGMVAVDPKTGGVLAYYGGADPNGLDWAGTEQEPGSSFKPFDLVGLLHKNQGLGKLYDSSPYKVPGIDRTITNASTPKCEECTVAEAMKQSLNSVFTKMVVEDVGPANVAKAAREAGITSEKIEETSFNIAIGGGNTRVSTLEMASAYATFASGGMRRPPHMIAKIEYPNGGTAWEASGEAKYAEVQAFDPDDAEQNQKIARNVTEALLPIPQSSGIPCAKERLCAGKTGTHQWTDPKNPGKKSNDNAKAWMVGYTPQVSTAVSLSALDGAPVRNDKDKPIYGAGVPGQIWQKFMNNYLGNSPKENFGRFVAIGEPDRSSISTSAKPSSTANSQPPVTTTEQPTTAAPTTTTPTGGEETTTTTTTSRTRPTKPGGPTETEIPLPGNN